MVGRKLCNVFTYRDEVVVELTVDEADQELIVRSFQFQYCDDARVRPKGALEEEYRADVEAALADEGYALTE